MATLSESFIGDIQKQNSEVRDSNAGAAIGAQLAALQQKRQADAAELKQKQAQLQQAKIDKLYSFVQGAHSYTNGGDRNTYLKNAYGYAAAMGLDQTALPQGALDGMGSDENMGRLNTLKNLVEAEQITPEQYFKTLNDKEAFAKINPTPAAAVNIGKVDADQALKDVLGRQASIKAAGMRAGGTQERFDTKLKTTLADKVNALGIPDIKVALNDLNAAVPGGIDGYKRGTPIPGISGGEAALPTNRLSGQALRVRQSAQSVGNQILKLRSGAAVTDGEAMRTLAELGMVPTIGEGGTWTGLTWKGTTSPEAFVNGMKRSRDIVAAKEKTYRNAYGADTYAAVVGDVIGNNNPPPVDLKAKAKEYLKLYPKGPGAAQARKVLEAK